MKRLLGAVVCTLLLVMSATPVMAEGKLPALSDTSGHWAEAAINQALQSEWVTGYPDGTLRPDDAITRAEFVKMLLAMQGLTPDSQLARDYVANSAYAVSHEAPLTDVGAHWLQVQGWLPVALAAGAVVTADYAGQFQPNRPITRLEVAVMLVRTVGRAALAKENETLGVDLPFKDADQVQLWAQSWLHEALSAGFMQGYPDGTIRPGGQITRAEAVIAIIRVHDSMLAGLDSRVQVSVVKSYSDWDATNKIGIEEVEAPMVVKMVDGEPLVPVQAVCAAAGPTPAGMHHPEDWQGGGSWAWDPVKQALDLRFATEHLLYTAGIKANTEWNDSCQCGIYDALPAAPVAPQLVNGVLYVHYRSFFTYTYRNAAGEALLQAGGAYDPATRHITITFPIPVGHPIS